VRCKETAGFSLRPVTSAAIFKFNHQNNGQDTLAAVPACPVSCPHVLACSGEREFFTAKTRQGFPARIPNRALLISRLTTV